MSVLLDAGAGDHWKYVEPGTEQSYERSEGIAVASLYMFLEGGYTNEANGTPFVDGRQTTMKLQFVISNSRSR